MNQFVIRALFLLTIAGLLNACSNNTSGVQPAVSNVQPINPVPQLVQPQNTYRSSGLSGSFQSPNELEPAVAFWRKTYTEWRRSEVAIHDDRYMDIIYEVMVIPGNVNESLTSEQKELVKNVKIFGRFN